MIDARITQNKLALGWFGIVTLAGFSVMGFVTRAQLGPWWVWSSNACRAEVYDGVVSSCGIMPMIVPATALGVALVGVGGIRVGHWVRDRGDRS